MEIQCTNIIYDRERGEIICVDTGEVISDHMIDFAPEWRAYTGEEWFQRARTGPALTTTVHDSGLVTDIDLSTRTYREKIKFIKLRNLHKKLRIAKDERKLVEALALMNQVTALMNLPDFVKESAGLIIRKIFDNITVKQNKIRAYVAAAIVIAARKHGVPLRAKDVIRYLDISEDEYWRAISELHFTLDPSMSKVYLDPRKFLGAIISKLGLSQKVYVLASIMIDTLKKRGYTEGKDPAGIAAAAVYVASIIANEKRTQKEIAEVANVTEVTIRNRYRDIVDKLYIEVEV